jgi:trimethylamine--corrinoid protein Co-methyltransferase
MDEQAALEAMLSIFMAKLSGANLVHDVGYMESGLATSFEMIVLTDELVSMTVHIMKGIEVGSDTLMIDEVDKVGPGGKFIDTENTLNKYRAFWFPSLLDRKIRSQWLKEGASTLGKRLNEKVKEILGNHRPPALSHAKKQRVNEILAKAIRSS